MRIGILWHVAYPWDVRMEKMIAVFLRAGHRVDLVCKGKQELAPREDQDGLSIHRIGPSRPKVLSYPLFFNPMWVARARSVFETAKPDVLVVRDLPLGGLAARLGEALDVPVVFDMAENYPAALMAYNKRLYKPFLFGNAWLPKYYERAVLRRMRAVFVVAEEQRDRLVAQGVPSARIHLIRNTPDLDFYRACASKASATNGGHANSLLYIGKVDAHRGIDLLVRAMPAVLRQVPDARLHVVGDGTQKQRIEQLAHALGVAQLVSFSGWLRFDQVPVHIARSGVCLIPHLKSEHTETTVPNKIFDYMAFGKPVVVSDCGPLARITCTANCGLVFRSGDAEDLARRTVELLQHPDRATFGENGQRAVVDDFNWGVDAARLLDAVERIRG